MKKNNQMMIIALIICSLSAITTAASPYTIEQYLNIRSASSPSLDRSGSGILYLSNVTGTNQVWMLDRISGKPVQLTNYDDNVSFVRWLGDGNGFIFGKAKGGDENTQFYWMKGGATEPTALTNEPSVRHNFGALSSAGDRIYYTSNKRDRGFFDVYSMDIATGRETLIYKQDGSNSVEDVNENGSKLIISRSGTELSLDNDLYLIDVRNGSETLLTPHSGSAGFGNAHFTADGIVYTHNDKREFIGLAELRKKNAAASDWTLANLSPALIDDTKWDVDDVVMETTAGRMAYVVNREGFSELYIRKFETDGKPLITVFARSSEQVALPARGIVSGLTSNASGTKFAFAFSSSMSNADIWTYDVETRKLEQVTHSDRAGVDARTFIEPQLVKFKSFDGLEVPAWYYRARGTITEEKGRAAGSPARKAVPVIVSVHGGPEGQERPGFNPLYQYYLSRGYAILATNVRGSTGYGKTYTHLDDVLKREDSVRDLASAVEWLKSAGNADSKRIAVMGGSYGGYMTLAAITLYPKLWAAAVDTVGIANWESFLKNTSGYRRRQREVEYGRLDRDLDFLRSISPLAKVDRITAPLFVIAGKNDPRVPYTEAEQIVGAIRKRGGVVEYKLYDDEGHGVSKLKNRLQLYPLVADFLDRYMK